MDAEEMERKEEKEHNRNREHRRIRIIVTSFHYLSFQLRFSRVFRHLDKQILKRSKSALTARLISGKVVTT